VAHTARLEVLGPPNLLGTEPNSRLEELSQPKRFAVLIYLAAAGSGGPIRREKLVGVFWPDRPETRGRNLLSQALHRFREVLGPDALSRGTAGAVALNPACLECDLWEFVEALAAGDEARALSLYRGPFLDGFFPDVHAFEDWAHVEQEHHRRSAVEAALRLAAREAPGPDCARWALWAVEQAPFDEMVLRESMRLLRDCGAPALALREYGDACQRFAEELGLDPSPETVALAFGMSDRGETDTPAGETAPPLELEARSGPASDSAPTAASDPAARAPQASRRPAGVQVIDPHEREHRRVPVSLLAVALVIVMTAVGSWAVLRQTSDADLAGDLAATQVLIGSFESDVEWLSSDLVRDALHAELHTWDGFRDVDEATVDSMLADLEGADLRFRGAEALEAGRALGSEIVILGEVLAAQNGALISVWAIDLRTRRDVVHLREEIGPRTELQAVFSRIAGGLRQALVTAGSPPGEVRANH
jgi:DNA-binding SARP family transcriptional activator